MVCELNETTVLLYTRIVNFYHTYILFFFFVFECSPELIYGKVSGKITKHRVKINKTENTVVIRRETFCVEYTIVYRKIKILTIIKYDMRSDAILYIRIHNKRF